MKDPYLHNKRPYIKNDHLQSTLSSFEFNDGEEEWEFSPPFKIGEIQKLHSNDLMNSYDN